MKPVLLNLALLWVCAFSGLQAQNPIRPNSILAKKLWIDHSTPKGGTLTDFDKYADGFEVAYLRNLGPYVNAVLPFKIGVIDLPSEINSRKMLGLDGIVQFQYFHDEKPVIPYVMTGIGGVFIQSEEIDFQLPAGLGVYFKMGNYGFLTIQSEYRFSLSNNRNNLQHGIGLGFMLGKYTEDELTEPLLDFAPRDKDRDGITDDEDDCPEIPGSAAFNGCPDTDGDGIRDDEDDCPQLYGSRKAGGCPDIDDDGVPDELDDCPDLAGSVNGCPDTDSDGVVDKDDHCPTIAGDKDNNGCPRIDTDGDGYDDSIDDCPTTAGNLNGCPDNDQDGIPDKDDKCPYAAGEGRFGGCPDTDGDGIDDSVDRCPNMAAPGSANGCPDIDMADRAVLDFALQAVQFEFGSSQLKPSSYAALEQVIEVLNKYPDYKLHIVGHTDNVGTEDNNQGLSQRRAKSCYDFMIGKQIPSNRLSYGGFGESLPIADNDTEEGRTLNRRVEFSLIVK